MANDAPLDGAEAPSRSHRLPSLKWVIVGGVVIVVLLWLSPTIAALVEDIDFEGLSHPYLIVFSFVAFDAVVPIFPSESLLTTTSNLAAQEGSQLMLWQLIAAGSLGAIVGDSTLYWLSRTVLRDYMAERVTKAEENPKIERAVKVLQSNAPLIIVFGRFVPGMRFVVAATMGLTRYHFPKFLLWDAVGGTAWASFTCVFSFLVASAVDDKPVLSIALSVVVTTALLALLYKPLKRSWEEADEDTVPTTADG